jgi:hypothetical protein
VVVVLVPNILNISQVMEKLAQEEELADVIFFRAALE